MTQHINTLDLNTLDLNTMITESRNPVSEKIDELSTLDLLSVINNQDKLVPIAVEKELPQIAKTVDAIVTAFKKGGRLIYMGAGTSGRLGILDASECPPTYGTAPDQVIGLIAGGHQAILKAVENAEDNETLAIDDLKQLNLMAKDIVVGIAASGRTPYVISGLNYANKIGAMTASISCNSNSTMSTCAQIAIVPIVGPEVITGSSRMKAGTAQKLILNMLTTGAMIRSGKVYGNLMVDVQASNLKLVERQKRIVMQATDCSYQQAEQALADCKQHCKTAIVMILTKKDAQQATLLLQNNDGFIKNTFINHTIDK